MDLLDDRAGLHSHHGYANVDEHKRSHGDWYSANHRCKFDPEHHKSDPITHADGHLHHHVDSNGDNDLDTLPADHEHTVNYFHSDSNCFAGAFANVHIHFHLDPNVYAHTGSVANAGSANKHTHTLTHSVSIAWLISFLF